MSFWNSRIRTARKDHRCEYCGRKIRVGERYSRETGLFGGDFNDYCLCLRCAAVLPAINDEPEYELRTMREDLIESDFLLCKNCKTDNYKTAYAFDSEMDNVTVTCGICGRIYTVSLSEAALLDFFA